MGRLLRGNRAALAVSTAALVLAAGGGAYAAASSGGTITVCIHKKGGALYQATKCSKGDKKLSWNAVGPQGATGATGPQGVSGVQGNTGSQGNPGQDGVGATILTIPLMSVVGGSTAQTVGTVGPLTLTETCTVAGMGTDLTLGVTQSGNGDWRANGFYGDATYTGGNTNPASAPTVSDTYLVNIGGTTASDTPILTVNFNASSQAQASGDLTFTTTSGDYNVPLDLFISDSESNTGAECGGNGTPIV
jgi:hypothetical protein